jgi:hypothetical protein
MAWERALPAVDVELFESVFEPWRKARESAAPGERWEAGTGVVFGMIDDDELFINIAWRLDMLSDIVGIAYMKEVKKYRGFPNAWIEIAATAPLNRGEQFDVKYFQWPTGEELKEFEEAARRRKAA